MSRPATGPMTPDEMSQIVVNATARLGQLREENARMRTVLREAGNQFHLHADLHLAKQPPDREKAAVNIHWAMKCHEAALPPDTTTEFS